MDASGVEMEVDGDSSATDRATTSSDTKPDSGMSHLDSRDACWTRIRYTTLKKRIITQHN